MAEEWNGHINHAGLINPAIPSSTLGSAIMKILGLIASLLISVSAFAQQETHTLFVPSSNVEQYVSPSYGKMVQFDAAPHLALLDGRPAPRDVSGTWFVEFATNLSIWQYGFHNSQNLSPTRCTGSLDPRWSGWVGRVGFTSDITYGTTETTLLASTVLLEPEGLWIYVRKGIWGEGFPLDLVPLSLSDSDRNRISSVNDIFTFIAYYTGNDLRADVDNNNIIDVEDIFLFLEAYFEAQ